MDLRPLRDDQHLDERPRPRAPRPRTGSATRTAVTTAWPVGASGRSTIALEEAGEVGIEARAKLRSKAVVRFEIARDPERTEGEIAKAARTSIGAVRNARKAMAG